MTIAKTRIHMICGICGSNEFLEYSIEENYICDNDGDERMGVCIKCKNCGSVTGLDEIIKEVK